MGRCVVTRPVVKKQNEDFCIRTETRLTWFPLKRINEDAGELLACFELFLLTDETRNLLPCLPPKKGALYSLPAEIRPKLQRTVIEVCGTKTEELHFYKRKKIIIIFEVLCWGLRNMKTFQLSDVDCPQIVFECGGNKLESEIIKNVKRKPNFSKPFLYFDVVSI